MMNSIVSGGFGTPNFGRAGDALSEAQSVGLKTVLGEFDSQNISESDAKIITQQVKDLGIMPGRGLSNAMRESGFDARDVAEKASISKDGPPSPKDGVKDDPKSNVNTEALTALTLLIESTDDGIISDEQWAGFLESMEEDGVDTSKPIFDLSL